MIRTWRMLRWNTLLAALLTTSPAMADPVQTSETALEQIKKQLGELKISLDDVKRSTATITTIEAELKDLRAESRLSVQTAQGDITSLKQEVARLKDEVETLRNRLSTNATRISGFGTTDAPPAAPTGRVEILNTYPGDISVVVNNRTYRLTPGQRRMTDPIPTGVFNYEVLGITGPRPRMLATNQVFLIHVHPQP